MGSTRLQQALEERVEELVHAAGPGERARSLLTSVASRPWVQACALWRRQPNAGGWTSILSRGAEGLLPDAVQLEEVATGRQSPDLIPGRTILVSGRGGDLHALAFAGIPDSEHELDWLAALLHVARLLDQGEPQDRGEELVAALPSPRPESSTSHVAAGACCVERALSELIAAERPACERASIQLELELAPSVDGVQVPLSAAEFRDALRNLLVNAREAQECDPSRGWIRVQASCSGEPPLLHVVVDDAGPGLPQHVQSALEARDPEALPGHGLGLAISSGIALGAGGALWPGTSPRGGARLELRLPTLRPRT